MRSVTHGDLFVLLILLLIWVPIPIGSNRAWSMALFEAGALSIFGIWALRYAYRPFGIPNSVRELRLALFLLLAWLCFPLMQLLPLPTAFVQSLTGETHELYAAITELSKSESAYFSLDRGVTLSGLLRQCALFAIFFAVLATVTTRNRLVVLMVVFFLVGFGEALYGLILYFGGDELGLWNPGHSSGAVSGTYVNQNHFAGLMEMTIPAGMGLLIMNREQYETGHGIAGGLRSFSSMLLGQRGILLLGLLVMFSALILSTSRGAVGSLGVAVFLAVLITVRRKGTKTRELKAGLSVAALIALAIFWVGADQLSSKLESSGLSSNRGDLRETSYRIFSDSPLLGTGVGTYRWVFPRFKDERFGSGFYEHAHNDYLEILGEQGIIGFSLLAIALGLITAHVVKAYRRRNDPLARGALFATLVGCMSLLIHGFVDFNFHIPGNAAYFSALLGIGVVAVDLGRRMQP